MMTILIDDDVDDDDDDEDDDDDDDDAKAHQQATVPCGSCVLRCTLVLSDGVVNSQADGLPSKPVDFGSFFFRLKDLKMV